MESTIPSTLADLKIAAKNKLSAKGYFTKPLKVVINLHNFKRDPNMKTTWSFCLAVKEEVDVLIAEQIFFPREEVKSVYINNRPYKLN